ncbi:MAG: DEAD/DEAH box helicase family protein [Streptococcaceae bacterium]|jgi:superfamily II DNA or RNA helicase|nr:DEAD/DEAH box helicase family protein [Streptococcaceae bacterium]
MLEGDKTKFIVLDFDKDQALTDVLAVIQSARKHQIELLIERSQSGVGIHLWLFFDEEIPAYLARKLGQLLLLDTTNRTNTNLMSYDRMNPMQDSLPKDSFGNLIALPLKWENVQEGKSTFLDENLNLVPIQYLWQHLAMIYKYSLEEVNQLIEKLEIENPIQEYTKEPSKASTKVIYPEKIEVQLNGELKISKENLTRQEQISLMYLATFKNPEYYKRQSTRTTTWNVPRLITSATEDNHYIYLPRGLKETLKIYVDKVAIDNQQARGDSISVDFKGKLYPEQEEALVAILENEEGILCGRTGFGKTIIAANLISQRKTSTLILVQNQNLARQWKDQLLKFLDIKSEPFIEYTQKGRIKKKEKVGIISGSKLQQTKVIDVAMIQKLARLPKAKLQEFLSNYGQVIVDECHHIAAKSFEEVIKEAPAKFILGLSATPQREDGLTPINFMRLGEVIFESEKISQDNLLIKNYLYPRYTSIGEIDRNFDHLGYSEQINFLAQSGERNKQITDDIQENYELGRTSLVLSERVEHLNILRDILEENMKTFLLSGSQTKRQNQQIISELKDEKQPFVLFATSKLVGEGFDLAQLDTLFLTLPFKAKGSHKQYLGRLQRDLQNKDELRVYDYVDISSGMFANMYQKRLKVYKEMEYIIAQDEATRKYQARLFSNIDYEKFFIDDLQKVENKIYLTTSILSKGICERLLHSVNNEVEIQVATKDYQQLSEHLKEHQKQQIKLLEENNISVKFLDSISQNTVIFDDLRCWYGNINFLSKSKNETSAVRFESEKIAGELKQLYFI